MLKFGSAIFAVVLTMVISSIIPYDNFFGLALKVGTFQIIGGIIGIAIVLLLKERTQHLTTVHKV
jgi:hypothetical protein